MEAPSPLFRVHRYRWQDRDCMQIWFTCPGCGEGHAVNEKWEFNGDFHNPTFSPSILCWNDPDPRAAEGSKYRRGWRCHSYIKDGQIEYLPDCTHALAGQTVPMVPFDVESV